MKIYTRIALDWDGNIIESESYDYHGPLALCDRSLVQNAKDASKTAQQTAGNYQAAGNQIQGDLVPRLEREAVNPTGYGTFGLGDMESAAEQSAAGASGTAQEGMRLRAMRTGNAAGLGSGQAAAAEGAARAGGSALQDILAKNAELKANQASKANSQLGDVLGENIHGNLSAQGLVPEDINAATNASKVGWVQNVEGLGDTAANLIKAFKTKGGGGGDN